MQSGVVRRRPSSPTPVLLALLAAVQLAACAADREWLNSDRIEARFGSYGVEILSQTPRRRISSLYSETDGERTMRTYAVVDFLAPDRDAYANEHRRIVDGASSGATLRAAGWTLTKQHRYIGAFVVPPAYRDIARHMRITLPEELATHVYVLVIGRDDREYDYATITEVHHPDYLDAAALRAIYGEILFDDSDRDALSDYIGVPESRK